MHGYTKLFGSIVTSTVWGLPDSARVMWITLLAIADSDGYVPASVPGLAKIAGVSREACEEALALFLAPDPDSRTTANEGRRIAKVDGGWCLLNHGIYRDLLSREDRRAKGALRQQRYRERLSERSKGAALRSVTICDASDDTQTQTQTQTQTERETRVTRGPALTGLTEALAAEARAVVEPSGEQVDIAHEWAKYAADRETKSKRLSSSDWRGWVLKAIGFARTERMRQSDRDRAADGRRRFAKEGPERPPPPTREQAESFAEQLAVRMRAARAGGQ